MTTRWMAVFDTHGDQIDRGAWAAAMEFAGHFKPDLRIGGGDHWDLRWLMSGASHEDAMEGALADVEAGIETLAEWAPHVRIKGNHCYRLDRAMNKPTTSGPTRDLCRMIVDRIADGIPQHDVLPYSKRDGWLKLGDYRLGHGFGGGGIGMARKHANVFGPCIIGHGHTPQVAASDRDDNACCYMSGCLCNLDMEYVTASLGALRWRHGFVYGVVTRSGKCLTWLAREEDGEWVLPSELATIRASAPSPPPSSDCKPRGKTDDQQEAQPAGSCESTRGTETVAWASSYAMPSEAASWSVYPESRQT